MIVATCTNQYGVHPVALEDVVPGAGGHKQVLVRALDGEPFVSNFREAQRTPWAVVNEDSLTNIHTIDTAKPEEAVVVGGLFVPCL